MGYVVWGERKRSSNSKVVKKSIEQQLRIGNSNQDAASFPNFCCF
jgi:hypothetical protein